jgi:flagellar biosynthesis anti-sigma factor FlgM
MVDDVSRVGGSKPQQANQTVKPNDSASLSPRVGDTNTQSTAAPAVEVELSKEVQRSEERAQFDEAKVRALKEQIEKGVYPIDPQKMAEKFADLEQLL